MDNLCQRLQQTSLMVPNKIAIEDNKSRIQYSQLVKAIRQFSGFVRNLGVRKGDRVVLCIESSIEYVIALYGCWFVGAIACPVSVSAKARELIGAVASTRASALIGDSNNRALRDLVTYCGIPIVLIKRPGGRIPEGANNWSSIYETAEVEIISPKKAEPALMLLTSGSSANSKAVLLSHGNLVANALEVARYLAIEKSDRVLVVLPLHYSYGNSVLLSNIAAGATVVLGTTMAFPQEVVNAIRQKKITGLSGVPSTFAILVDRTDWEENPGALRYVTQAGGAMSASLTRKLQEILGESSKLFVMYGQTEATARITYLAPEDLDRKFGSVGKAIRGVTIQIRDENGKCLDAGQPGEVFVTGANVMLGYWENDAATKSVFQDGWLGTGDIGYTDPEGFLYLIGRNSAMIKTGGHRVHPEEIEEVVGELNGVQEVAAAGMNDELLGQSIQLFVVGDQRRLLKEEIIKHCRQNLASHKVPREIKWVDRLPRTESGKLKRHELT